MIAKNSFYEGVARGYCMKIHSLKKEYTPETSQSLMVIENKLMNAKAMVYPRLYTTRSQRHRCGFSSALGEKVGKHLSINPAVHQSPLSPPAYLTYE
jgi:hypothetical protein